MPCINCLRYRCICLPALPQLAYAASACLRCLSLHVLPQGSYDGMLCKDRGKGCLCSLMHPAPSAVRSFIHATPLRHAAIAAAPSAVRSFMRITPWQRVAIAAEPQGLCVYVYVCVCVCACARQQSLCGWGAHLCPGGVSSVRLCVCLRVHARKPLVDQQVAVCVKNKLCACVQVPV